MTILVGIISQQCFALSGRLVLLLSCTIDIIYVLFRELPRERSLARRITKLVCVRFCEGNNMGDWMQIYRCGMKWTRVSSSPGRSLLMDIDVEDSK